MSDPLGPYWRVWARTLFALRPRAGDTGKDTGMTDYPERTCPWRPDQPCPWRPVGRDAELIRLVALGWTDYRIGEELGMATTTVSHRVGRLCRMLGLDAGRAQLAGWAGAHGYVPP